MSRAVSIITIVFLVFAALNGQCLGQSAKGRAPTKARGRGKGAKGGIRVGPKSGGTSKAAGGGGAKGKGGSGGKLLVEAGIPRFRVGFYDGKCGSSDVEAVVRDVVKTSFNNDSFVTPRLLRMQFHDCFVNGCDASILIDGNNTEKTAGANLSVQGYEVIDAAKSAVEAICPGVVSCADIIVMATRDAVALAGGENYTVPTGRRDGNVSLATNVNLPSPSISVSQSISVFASKGLNTTDMVLLLGGHTVGISHCAFFRDRLYNFQNTGKPDPTMDSALLESLQGRCPQVRDPTVEDNIVALDSNFISGLTVDNSYYQQIVLKRGVLQIDQELALDPQTNATVAAIATGSDFTTRFGQAMKKLGRVQVLTGKQQGEIRRSCRAIN